MRHAISVRTMTDPYFFTGKIIKGFGRGSKELGIPTANYPLDVIRSLPKDIDTGVYYGFASVNNSGVHKMVMSIGWNPFYNNQEKSMETHIMHNYNSDLCGKILKVCILGYLRPEMNFDSLQLLIDAIQDDITTATQLLDDQKFLPFKNHKFFNDETGDS